MLKDFYVAIGYIEDQFAKICNNNRSGCKLVSSEVDILITDDAYSRKIDSVDMANSCHTGLIENNSHRLGLVDILLTS